MGFDIYLRLRPRLCSAAIASAALVVLTAMAGPAVSARAATYTVGTLKDVPGTCAEPASGSCSLRQLVDYENALPATPNPTDVIVVPAGKYDLSNGELAITQSLAIVGAGARTTNVDVPARGTPARVFDIQVPGTGTAPTVAISGLEISGGTANESNGFFGGDVLSAGSLVLDEDWITAGTASSGGGVSNNGGTLVVERSLVSGNHASSGGGDSGGIQNHGTAVCGAACFPGKKAVLTVEDSTVAYNDARLGAGIFSWSDASDGNEVSVIDSTIADNTTKEEAGGAPRGPGAGLLISDGTAGVANSIVAFNAEISVEGQFSATNCSTSEPAKIASLGYNLENGTDCGFTSTGDRQSTFPDFSSSEPQNNGGATNTLALEPTSPGVDAIPAGNPNCDGSDQRGVARPQGAGCDVGAVELVPFTIEATEGATFSAQITTARCSIFGTPTIEWGDGQQSNATVREGEIGGSHTYAEAGTYNGSVSYEDDCGLHRFPFQAKVADAPLSATGVPVKAHAGVKFSATVATLSDANPDSKASDYTATIKWGDGSSAAGTIGAAPGGGFEVRGSHSYAGGGVYKTTVTVSDVGGSKATATSSANVIGPPIVSEVSVGSVTVTTATVKFAIDPNGADTTYLIRYGHSASYGQETKSVDIGATRGAQQLEQTLTGLEPNSTYHFDVVAINSQAPEGESSEDQTFATRQKAPAVVTGSASAVTQTTATLKATVNPNGSNVTGCELEYGETEDYGSSAPCSPSPGSGKSAVAVSAGIEGLVANTTYHFRIVAVNGGGEGVGKDQSFITLPSPVVSLVLPTTSNQVGTPFSETATVTEGGTPLAGVKVTFTVTGANPQIGVVTTDEAGQATFAYTGEHTGTDHILASFIDEGSEITDEVTKTWTEPISGGGGGTGGGGNETGGNGGAAGGGGSGPGGSGGVLAFKELSPPVLGKTVNVVPVSGVVYVELPPGAHFSLAEELGSAFASLHKGVGFVPLAEARQIPVGSILDTTGGVVGITTATTSARNGKLQSGDFGAGIFKLLQQRRQRGLTDLDIIDAHSARRVCATRGKARIAAARPSGKVLGRLNASGHGRFTARGQYSAATVRGTVWSVADRCDGTLTRVTRGVVSVRDFHRRKTITLFTGQSYLARAPVKRG